MPLALQFEPTGRKRRTTRLFSAQCSSCGARAECPQDEEPWGWARGEQVSDFRAAHDHGSVFIRMRIVEQ